MLNIDELEYSELRKIQTACAYLFTIKQAEDIWFLRNLSIELVKKAFREKVKRYHPDLHQKESDQMIKKRIERFTHIQESNELLTSYLVDKFPVDESIKKRGKVIAIGGAKGGIGKSIFAANLGVFLTYMGKSAVVVDLDLGGANLHLYLGETSIKKKINDYLNNNVPNLKDLMIKSKYGPYLIGGDSSKLGAANLNFFRKLKLLRAVQFIDMDYIILDLGGDTSYNIVDFFLSADYSLVMTTLDPASYLDAYRFIKVSLYRKLQRMFGPESKFKFKKDSDLEHLINDSLISQNGANVKNIKELTERVKRQKPDSLVIMNEVLNDFHPRLVINKANNPAETRQIVKQITDVSKSMLSINVEHLGSLSDSKEVETSARDFVPVLTRHPNGVLAKEMGAIVDKLLKE